MLLIYFCDLDIYVQINVHKKGLTVYKPLAKINLQHPLPLKSMKQWYLLSFYINMNRVTNRDMLKEDTVAICIKKGELSDKNRQDTK